ncbi:TPA: maleate cis-trans isomerase [Candidatus Poribacteria bacterium]|nr:maleate cis-trans isomerase [Candidatus Poribacteria bacterium]
MYGWKGKIGLLVPSVNTVVEPETNRMAPEGINIYATRMRNATVDVENTRDMLSHLNRAADELASAKMDVIAFACTAGSFFEGTSGEQELKTTIERIASAPAVTTSGAVVKALRLLHLNKIVVATPYPDDMNNLERKFLVANGFDALDIKGLGIVDAWSIGAVTPEETYDFARKVFSADADGMFISCTNLRTIEVIERLEKETGKPVVTSNQATFWACLRAIRYTETIQGYGKLFENK